MKRVTTILIVLLAAVSIFWIVAYAASPGPDKPTKETPQPSEKTEEIVAVEDAIYQKMDQERQNTIFFWNQTISVKNTQISYDGQWAASIMVPENPNTGQSPETEPALAISIKVNGEWKPLFPNDPEWVEAVKNAPEDLLSKEHKEVLLFINMDAAVNMPAAAIGGYLLPWDKNVSYYLTGSTCHDEYIPSGNAHYAFDFAYNRTMWDILAAKAAEVWVWQDDVPTCYIGSCWQDQPVGNYIVLRDTSTNPVTYQLYLHLKQDSIPDEIKVRGFQVAQGQFIGIVDNTGQSAGSHLHFQVQVPYLGEDHYWGRSVDITFDDVAINGGRPRIHDKDYCLDRNFCDEPGDVCGTSQLYYTSQNQRVYPKDSTPPIGDILNPLTGETYGATLPLEGWAQDLGDGDSTGSGLQSAQFMAFYNGGWTDIGPDFDNLIFSYDWDWCAQDVPDGPVSVALRLTDNRGNQTSGLPGLRHVTMQYDCPPHPPLPTCQPNLNQVAIFSEINFQGACQTLNIGDFPNSTSFGPVGDNNTQSILVGANVQADLFAKTNYQGRNERLQRDDSNLSDNPTATRSLSSLKVSDRTTSLTNTSPPDLMDDTSINNSTSSSVATFTAPYSDTLEGDTSSWTANGLWHLSTTNFHSTNHSFRYADQLNNNYDDGKANKGTLESPLITLPVSSDPYVLQFWYRYQTESHYAYWDQRWLQISVDGGKNFDNIYQLSDDPMLGWLQARINLSDYVDQSSEQTIKVRFLFKTVDRYNNNFEGWFIDDFQVQAEPATSTACPFDGNEPNGSSGTATIINYGDTENAAICPGWDLDYYQFAGTAGDRVVVDIDARSFGSELDGYLYLLDSDGGSELAENDDEILYEKQDPLLGYLLPRDGQYYLKVHAWDHPMGTGEYTLNLIKDHQKPSVLLTNPIEASSIPLGKVTLSAQATDGQSAIRYVKFLVHDNNWETGKWVEVGSDYDGSDGWSTSLDTSSFSDGETISIYAAGYDWGGNWDHDAAWIVKVDAQPLTLKLWDLPNPAQSTAQRLQWVLDGAGSETAIVNLQVKVNNGSWNDLLTNTNLTEYWFVGKSETSYAFKVTAKDFAGNELTKQTDTNIPAPSQLCSKSDNWDVSPSQNDNNYSSATSIGINDTSILHNFCNPAASNYLNDEDWLKFTAEKDQHYILTAKPQGDKSAAVTIRLYAKDGASLLAEEIPAAFGQSTELNWKASGSGTFYIQLMHINGDVAGNDVLYNFHLSDGSIYMPIIGK